MKINEYNINTSKLVEDKKIAVISDIHIDCYTKEKKLLEILDTLDSIKPTQVVIPGDLYNVDEKTIYTKNNIVSNFLKSIADISETFYVKGNSEMRTRSLPYKMNDTDNERFHMLCENSSITHTSERIVKSNDLNIAGIRLYKDFYNMHDSAKIHTLEMSYKRYIDKLAKYCSYNNFNILLCHDPIIIDVYNKINSIHKFDLIISGHNHGGLLPEKFKPLLKFVNADISKLFPKYIKGSIQKEDTTFIVSEGITKFHSESGVLKNLEPFHDGTIDIIKIKTKQI